jgi:glycosyltransferase involved in cell wall biosynthesis
VRISTIIPAYNRADLIGETLRTVLEQDRPPDEVIVVDDGSSDGTPDLIAAYGKAVTLIRQANAGPGPARNAGFVASRGDIVHFMDSDDLISLNFYAVAAAAIEGGADMTYGPWLKTGIQGRTLTPEAAVIQQGPVPPRYSFRDLLMLMDWGTVFQPCLFRREAIERAGPYRCDLTNWEDNDLLYRIAGVAGTPVHVAASIALYRVHPEDQLTRRPSNRRTLDHARLAAIFDGTLASRTDAASALRRAFRRRKVDIAREARLHDPLLADALVADVSKLDYAAARLLPLVRRVRTRLGAAISASASTSASTYPPTYAPAPLREDQRREIARLGYILPD